MATIQQMLKQFAAHEECERYKGDSKKIELVCLYLLLRQLTPTLSFEEFLSRFRVFADATEENLKMPDVAVDSFLPRAKAKADKLSRRQWQAKEVLGYLALYVDMIREAEQAGEPVPLKLNEWLSSPELQGQYLNGDFDTPVETQPAAKQATQTTDADTEDEESEPAEEDTGDADVVAEEAPAKKSKTKATKAKSAKQQVRPQHIGTRVLYTHPKGQQVRGVTTSMATEDFDDSANVVASVDVMDDSGQLHEGVLVENVTVIDDPLPQPPQNVSPQQATVVETILVAVTPEEISLCHSYLERETMSPKVEADGLIWEWAEQVTHGGVAYDLIIQVKNGTEKSSPYVDAYAIDPDSPRENPLVVTEINPREFSLLGRYSFILPCGTVLVEVLRDNENGLDSVAPPAATV